MKISLSKKEVETAIREKYGEGEVTVNDDGSADLDTEKNKKRLGFRSSEPDEEEET